MMLGSIRRPPRNQPATSCPWSLKRAAVVIFACQGVAAVVIATVAESPSNLLATAVYLAVIVNGPIALLSLALLALCRSTVAQAGLCRLAPWIALVLGWALASLAVGATEPGLAAATLAPQLVAGGVAFRFGAAQREISRASGAARYRGFKRRQ